MLPSSALYIVWNIYIELAPWQRKPQTQNEFAVASSASTAIVYIIELSIEVFVGRGGSLVDSMPFVQRVVGSNPTLAAT